jgi:uncharacterized protein YndB with AHSA1/START domain
VAVDQPEVATVVEREIRIAARPETVFEFFVDPEKMVQWKGRTAELDPRPGGVYRVEINEQAIARGEYVEIEAPSRVVFTWGWEGQESGEHAVPPGSSRVEIELTPVGDGRSYGYGISTCLRSRAPFMARDGTCTSGASRRRSRARIPARIRAGPTTRREEKKCPSSSTITR